MVYTKTTWVAGTAPGISATNLNNLETQYDKSVVIGEIKLYAGSTAPTDFFLCNGTSKSNITYAALYAVTGYKFGGSSTWFNLPNMMGHFPVGLSSNAGSYSTMGSTGGEETHTLTTAEMPNHTHNLTVASIVGAGQGLTRNTGVNTVSTASEIAAVGSGSAHNNMPPYVVLNYIIRYQ